MWYLFRNFGFYGSPVSPETNEIFCLIRFWGYARWELDRIFHSSIRWELDRIFHVPEDTDLRKDQGYTTWSLCQKGHTRNSPRNSWAFWRSFYCFPIEREHSLRNISKIVRTKSLKLSLFPATKAMLAGDAYGNTVLLLLSGISPIFYIGILEIICLYPLCIEECPTC